MELSTEQKKARLEIALSEEKRRSKALEDELKRIRDRYNALRFEFEQFRIGARAQIELLSHERHLGTYEDFSGPGNEAVAPPDVQNELLYLRKTVGELMSRLVQSEKERLMADAARAQERSRLMDRFRSQSEELTRVKAMLMDAKTKMDWMEKEQIRKLQEYASLSASLNDKQNETARLHALNADLKKNYSEERRLRLTKENDLKRLTTAIENEFSDLKGSWQSIVQEFQDLSDDVHDTKMSVASSDELYAVDALANVKSEIDREIASAQELRKEIEKHLIHQG